MMDPLNKLALETIQIGKQALIFAPTRASAEKSAEEVAKLTSLQYPELAEEVLKVVSPPTKQCQKLASTIKKALPSTMLDCYLNKKISSKMNFVQEK